MSAEQRPGFHDLPVSQARAVDQVCDAFERELAQGKQPCIGDYLLMVPEAVRDMLRAELAELAKSTQDVDRTPSAVSHANRSQGEGSGMIAGRYRLIGSLGRGGMGEVFLAEDLRLRRQVAIKFIRQDLSDLQVASRRFLREARAMAAIHHENVIPIHEIGETSAGAYFVMPLLDGEPLRARLLRDRLLSASEVRRLGADVAAGLSAAHLAGLIHRDVKPENIWLWRRPSAGSADTWTRAILLDFGLARTAQSIDPNSDKVTGTGNTPGTIAYMSPEQLTAPEHVGPVSDLFGLGIVLYEAITGSRPFQGSSPFAVMEAIVSTEPRPPSELVANIPADLEAVIVQLLEKDPTRRPVSAEVVVTALHLQAGSDTRVSQSATPRSRRPLILAGGGGLALIGLLGAMMVLSGSGKTTTSLMRENINGSTDATEVRPRPDIEPSSERDIALWVFQIGGTLTISTIKSDWERVRSVDRLPDSQFRIVALDLEATPITDDDLRRVSQLPSLEAIDLRDTRVTDVGFGHLKPCRGLVTINVNGATNLSDRTAELIAGFPRITYAYLDDTAITDQGLLKFLESSSLVEISVEGTRVTPSGVEQLKKARPDVKVY